MNKYGLMGQGMLAHGKVIKRMEKVLCIILMAISIKENGLMTKQAEKECIPMKMGQGIRGSGDKISKMVLENNNGQMVKYMKENIKMAARTVKGS